MYRVQAAFDNIVVEVGVERRLGIPARGSLARREGEPVIIRDLSSNERVK